MIKHTDTHTIAARGRLSRTPPLLTRASATQRTKTTPSHRHKAVGTRPCETTVLGTRSCRHKAVRNHCSRHKAVAVRSCSPQWASLQVQLFPRFDGASLLEYAHHIVGHELLLVDADPPHQSTLGTCAHCLQKLLLDIFVVCRNKSLHIFKR